MQRVRNVQPLKRQQVLASFLQALEAFRVDRLQEPFQFAKHFIGRLVALNIAQAPEQPRQLAPVTLRELALDVPLLVNQTTLHHRVGKELLDRASQGGAAIENHIQTMIALETASDDATHQFTRNLQAFAAPQDKVQDMLVALPVDPQGNHRRLLAAKPNAVEHQRTPSDRGQLFAAQLVDKLGTCFLPQSRDVGATDAGEVWLELSGATTRASRSRKSASEHEDKRVCGSRLSRPHAS